MSYTGRLRSLSATWNVTCTGVMYVLGSKNSNTCPGSSTRILDAAACRSAAETKGYTYGIKGSWGTYPRGCEVTDDNEVYLNVHPTGGNKTTAAPLCDSGAHAVVSGPSYARSCTNAYSS